MSWRYLPGPVEEFSRAGGCSDGGLSVTLRKRGTASMLSKLGSGTASMTMPRSGMTLEHSTGDPGVDAWILLLRDSPVSPSALPEKDWAKVTSVTCGPKHSAPSAKYDPDTRSWKTCQGLLPLDTLEPSKPTSMQAGMTQSGYLWELAMSGRYTEEREFGYWPTPKSTEHKGGYASQTGLPTLGRMPKTGMWPTPQQRDWKDTGENTDYEALKKKCRLPGAVMWPTPAATEARQGFQDRSRGKEGTQESLLTKVIRGRSPGGTPTRRTWATPDTQNYGDGDKKRTEAYSNHAMSLHHQTGGQLNPDWVELLMGWPLGVTCLNPINVVEFSKWLVGFTSGTSERTSEKMRHLQETDDSQEVFRESPRRLDGMEEAEILQSFMCEHKETYNEVGLALAGKEASEEEVRSLWREVRATGASRRRELQESESRESSNLVHSLSQVYPRYGIQAWMEGTWEATVPRVAKSIQNRVDRLKAIGNGQVPIVAAAAWNLLRRRINEPEPEQY